MQWSELTADQERHLRMLEKKLGAAEGDARVVDGPTAGKHPDTWLMDVEVGRQWYRVMHGQAIPLTGRIYTPLTRPEEE